ncbi:MAG: SEC-C metal-binding domain-containing protein [Acidobacteriota bacterium]
MFRNSGLLLSRWFFGSTGREDEGRIPPHKRLILFLLFLILGYGPLWLAVQSVQSAYAGALAHGAEQICSLLRLPFVFGAEGDQLIFRSYTRPAFEADLSIRGVVSNMAFLLTLILMTPGMHPSNRAFRLAAGAFLLYLSHVAFVITKVEVSLLAAGHPLAGANGLWTPVDNFFEITGKVLFPVLFWLLLGLPYMMGRIDRRRGRGEEKEPGRNDPCSCGSGKKYKYCCGR